MADSIPLSPDAQAVLDAVEDDCIHPDDKHRLAAAALRAAADQVVPEEKACDFVPGAPQTYALQRCATRRQLLAIATELNSLGQ